MYDHQHTLLLIVVRICVGKEMGTCSCSAVQRSFVSGRAPYSGRGSVMPVIPVGSHIFDLAFHPTSNVVYTGLLDGKVKAFTYDDQGAHSAALSLRISKRSCRGVTLNPDGSALYAVGKNRSLQCVSLSFGLARKCVIIFRPCG